MIKNFEELIAWQAARRLNKRVYELTARLEFKVDRALMNQMRRASISAMSNIAEGFERGNNGDFHRFPSISKSSCAELRSQLYVCLDVGYIDAVAFEDLQRDAVEVGRIIGGLRESVARRRIRHTR